MNRICLTATGSFLQFFPFAPHRRSELSLHSGSRLLLYKPGPPFATPTLFLLFLKIYILQSTLSPAKHLSRGAPQLIYMRPNLFLVYPFSPLISNRCQLRVRPPPCLRSKFFNPSLFFPVGRLHVHPGETSFPLCADPQVDSGLGPARQGGAHDSRATPPSVFHGCSGWLFRFTLQKLLSKRLSQVPLSDVLQCRIGI